MTKGSAGRPRSTLDGMGELIEMGVILGIGHRWYPYDIALLALRDGFDVNHGCDCP